jgi:hypothetical protein
MMSPSEFFSYLARIRALAGRPHPTPTVQVPGGASPYRHSKWDEHLRGGPDQSNSKSWVMRGRQQGTWWG